MLVELRMRRRPPRISGDSPIDGIRILALLPEKWHKDLRQATGDVIIRVHADDYASSEDIRAEVTARLTDPAVSNWEVVTCDILTNGL